MHHRLLLVTVIGALLAACGPDQSGSTPKGTKPIAWQSQSTVLDANGAPPTIDVATVCGSDTATYLAELTTTSPLNAKVNQEWADAVSGGEHIAVAGSVTHTHLGPQDLPMSHELGDDLSMNVKLDTAFVPYTHQLGTGAGDTAPDEIHTEISSGYIPHVPSAAGPATGQTWAQMADKNRTSFQSGFDIPKMGDRILVQGRYIIDCGHDNYGTELHAMSFLAWADETATKTTVRTYYNPYRDTERYDPDFTILGNVRDQSRFTLPETKPFPGYLADEVIRLLAGETTMLRSYGLLDAEVVSPKDWTVCAPAGTSGSKLDVFYDFVTRTGVTVTATPDRSTGCVKMHTDIGASYQAPDITLRKCVLPWAYLSQVAQAAVGDPNLDVKQLIINQIGQSNASLLDKDPEIACGDALAGPKVSASPTGQNVKVDDSQPFPFYGVVTVDWHP